MRSPRNDKQEVETTGHSWDGIQEYNNPLPRWWVWILLATIVWGIGYSIAYPAWPLIKGATPGLLGFSTRAQVAADIAAVDQANAALTTKLASADLTTIKDDPTLYGYAVNMGAAVFRANCSQCHGAGAAGNVGFPNLLDNDWLWGGKITDIAYTVQHGVRNEQDPDARYSQMPAWGEILQPEEIHQVVNYVLQISGQQFDATLADAGKQIFADNCAACHGDDGKGNRDVGAPNLTDKIWLYGGDEATLTKTVTYSRFGVMPAWGLRLSQAQVNAAAVYVHQLGGGE
ncbi:MAG: cytochrome-c oxidase, cbb3-type subunit III [Limimaricola sp.]|uniref:cytochrome-c oxidase, cbb3-type subunit III n=1 Tax=Limimaricola sp. TaxID=2211665 RepID=UPI001D64C6B2|nr:cytochrome-c oxidase, cbb3-type subunit III [Limimaricola sp.]MBI1418790.1 cytochrome-c oxidase, cbb3-type subunit III [Limimaricola sp.]